MKRNTDLLLISIALLLTLTLSGVAVAGNLSERKEVVESSEGIEYHVVLDQENSAVIITYENPTKEESYSGFVLRVDQQRVREDEFNLSVGERHTEKINITPGINVNHDEHTVTFSTFGGHAQFNFTWEINSTESGEIPTPYVSDVEVTTGTIDGESSTVAKVTVVNPSDQLYSTKLMVHTLGTDGSLYPASVRPGESRTITVELLDDPEGKITGEARLYTGNLTTEEGAMDQVEFAGSVDDETRVWNTSYEPVRPTWMDDRYQYRNDSYDRSFGEKLSGGHEVAEIPLIYLVGVVLLGWLAVRKLR